MEEEQRESGISLGEIFSMIWKRIIWVLGASVLVALIAGLVTKFVIAPSKAQYQISFLIEYPNQDQESTRIYYPDGTLFRYETIVYADNLNAVGDSKDEFKDIDTERMASQKDIVIEEKTRVVGNTTQNLGIYTITVTGNYFSDKDQATEFLHALCEYTVSDIIEIAENRILDANLINYDSVATFEEQIALLENQSEYLLAQYDNYTEFYGDYVYEGKTLNACRAEVSNMFSGDRVKLAVLKLDLENNRYLHNQTVDDVLTNIRSLELERKANDASIVSLSAKVKEFLPDGSSSDLYTSEGLTAYHTQIANYVDRNAKIDIEIEELYESIGYVYSEAEDGYIDSEHGTVDETQFKANLTYLYQITLDQTEQCSKVLASLYRENTAFRYEQNSAVYSSGVSTILYTVIAFVLAFVVMSVIVCLIESYRKKRAESKAAGAADKQPQTNALHLEAAVTEEGNDEHKNE